MLLPTKNGAYLYALYGEGAEPEGYAAFARDHRRDEKYRTGDFMRQYPMSGEDYGNE